MFFSVLQLKGSDFIFIHRKHCIESEGKFDFLKDLVANIADVATQEEEDGAAAGASGENGDKPKRTYGINFRVIFFMIVVMVNCSTLGVEIHRLFLV